MSFILKSLFVLLISLGVVWFYAPLRAKAYRIFVKMYAKHAEEEEVDNLRQKIGLSKDDVNMGELLSEKSKIAGGQTNPLDSVMGDLKQR